MGDTFQCYEYETCPTERIWFTMMWTKGMSFRSIAKRAGRSPTTVRRWVRRLLGQYFLSLTRGVNAPSEMTASNLSYDAILNTYHQYMHFNACLSSHSSKIDCFEKCIKEYYRLIRRIPMSFESHITETCPVFFLRHRLNALAPCSDVGNVYKIDYL